MTNRIEEAVREWAEEEFEPSTRGHEAAALLRVGTDRTATYLSDWLLSPENVERMARAVHEHLWPEEDWDSMPEQYQQDIMAQERASLRAIIEGEGS